MTAAERIDANLDRILRASGSALRHYTMPSTLAALRRETKANLIRSTRAGPARIAGAADSRYRSLQP